MKSNWNAFAGVVLIFLLGCLAGGFGASAFFIHRTAVFMQRGAPAYIELLERRLSRGISLDDNQKEQIHQIFMNNLEQRQKLQAQIQPQVQELNHDTVRQIKGILHPDQLQVFDKNLIELHRRFSRLRFNSGPPSSATSGTDADATNPAPVNPAGP